MLFAETTTLWVQGLGFLVIVLAIWAVARQYEVRLTMLVAGLLLALLAGRPEAVVQRFLETFADEKFVVPIGTAMGFAYVLRLTGCDQHLVHLLVRPLLYVRLLLVPGTVVVGFLVNMPIVSQTSTAATLGPVVVPILRAANISPITTGAALVLGSSIGGELLNPGAPEMRTVVSESQKAARRSEGTADLAEEFDTERCLARLLPLNLTNITVVTLLFWAFSLRHERAAEASADTDNTTDAFRVNLFKAAVPLLPLIFLYLASPPFNQFQVPAEWLRSSEAGSVESRLIGAAMVMGAAIAALTQPQSLPAAVRAFCEGAGYAFANIISLITAANCFGAGLREIGVAALLGRALASNPGWILPLAGLLSVGFATLSGSGMATTQSLFGFFAAPSLDADIDPTHTGAIVALAAAAGRSISPVSAVALVVASLTGTHPMQLARRLAVPVLISLAITVLLAVFITPAP